MVIEVMGYWLQVIEVMGYRLQVIEYRLDVNETTITHIYIGMHLGQRLC